MALQQLTGKWTGRYVYGEGYSVRYLGKAVPFEMDIFQEGYQFTGTCIDDETKDLLPRPAAIFQHSK